MSLIKEGEWTRPYETFGPNNIAEKLREIRAVEKMMGEQTKSAFLDITMGEITDGSWSIDFDYPYLSQDDKGLADGYKDLIHYPKRKPIDSEIVEKKLPGITVRNVKGIEQRVPGRTVKKVEGFGQLGVTLMEQRPNNLEVVEGRRIYPFNLELRVDSEEYSSTPSPYFNNVDNYFNIHYHLWTPSSEINPGVIFLPTDLPTLVSLEFRLTKFDPIELFRNLPRKD